MPRIFKDPLVHFLLIGAAIFALSSWRSGSGQDERRVVVPEAEVAGLWQAMTMISGAAPSEADLRALVEPRIREEILYREALRLGLDRDDSQIRQRLVEKMSFLNEDLNAADPPGDGEIATFYEANRDAFEEPARVTLEQIYFSPSEYGSAIADVARATLAKLQMAAGDPAQALVGDLSVRLHDDATIDELRGELGEDFATAIMGLPADAAWHGPVLSVFGAHLVRVTARTEARLPPLSEIHERVVAALNAQRRQRANEAAYQAIRSAYDVVIEIPDEALRQWKSEPSPE